MIFRPILALIFALNCVAAYGQNAPQIYLDNTRRIQGDEIRVCVDDTAVGAPFDRAVAEAIGQALFLNVVFDKSPSGFPINGGGFLEELQIRMNKNCDLVMGMSLQTGNLYPDWVSPTRVYATVPYVLAALDPSYESLSDIPNDHFVGTSLGSSGEWAFITAMSQRAEGQRWKRLPYADKALMLERLRDGRLSAILLWQPMLQKLLSGDPDAADIRVISPEPIEVATVRVGGLVSSRDDFLRSQIDSAIDALIQDGTISMIMDDLGFEGTPGG
ncbi:substrate-binding periplasmic protein [Celeribacter sp.]|uniref:substrate-binding periplasmic protein n=1 Tax=Celeribacter sp. TaxID=1890673 RepID=UPI003A921212